MPEFSTQRNLKAPEQFPEGSTVSEDDSVILHLKASCDVAKAAHASIAFQGSSHTRGKVVMMKAGNDAQSLKGRVKVADLKPLVRDASGMRYSVDCCIYILHSWVTRWIVPGYRTMYRCHFACALPANPSMQIAAVALSVMP